MMLLLAVPAAWMWAEPPPVTTAGAWTTCCWWGRSKGFPVTPPAPAPPLLSRSTLSLVAKRRLNVRRRNPIIFLRLRVVSAGSAPRCEFPPPPPSFTFGGKESLRRIGDLSLPQAAAGDSGRMLINQPVDLPIIRSGVSDFVTGKPGERAPPSSSPCTCSALGCAQTRKKIPEKRRPTLRAPQREP